MSNMELQLRLKLNDQMSRGLKAALSSAQKESKSLERDIMGIAKASNNIKPTGIFRMTEALNKARSAAKSTFDMIQKAAQAGASVAAAGYVLKSAADKPMEFDKQLAYASNIAYKPSDRAAGKAQMAATIKDASRKGNISQEGTLAVLSELYGSGAMSNKSADKLLPTIMKTAYGNNADASDLAKIAISAKQSMGLTDDQIPLLFSKMIASANAGGFEIKNMANSFPEQMAKYSSNGMKGMRGIDDLLAYNQVANITSGTPAATGINMINFLNKANSIDTQKDFKKHGINLTKELAEARGRGESVLDSVLNQVDKVVGKDKNYKMLSEKLKSTKGAEKEETIKAMLAIVEQAGLGSVFQDSQVMTAVLGARQNKQKLNEIRDKVRNDDGSQIEANYLNIRNTASGSADALAISKDNAANGSLGLIDGSLQSLLNGVASFGDNFPNLATAAYSATTAIAAMAASAGVFAFLSKGGETKPATYSVIKEAAKPIVGSALSALPALSIGALPLGGIYTATKWAGDTTHDKARAEFLLNISKSLQSLFSDKEAEYAAMRKKSQDALIDHSAKPIRVIVDVKNGNIVASVNETNSRQASRK